MISVCASSLRAGVLRSTLAKEAAAGCARAGGSSDVSRRCFASIERIGVDDPRMSRIVKHNGIVYISGQTDATAADIEGQTKNVLAKVDDLLEQAGTSKRNLLTSSIWLKDIGRDFKQMNAVWNNWVDSDNKPVRATVEAAMARPQLLIEVQVTATTADD
eukprot:CAMPEP_0197719808 /NCGR_PEP_ID=MMETSP1434-20131217/3410_1 /TAXON_ID=265543 /ORGANISM="Minutocellus polymorphus, Strain CCMP3303" /LENGTH=159 /DNA_ID=CAMNT_0043304587 /DNA_START=113 /DNA_END=592 /DNA_ORIENTATION=-